MIKIKNLFMLLFLFLFLSLFSISSCSGMGYLNFEFDSWACQLQDADPEEISKSGFDIVVIDYSRDGTEMGEYSTEDLETIKEAGIVPIAYISIGEAEDYRFYWKESWYNSRPEWLGHENENWDGNYAVRYWYDEWKEIIFEYLDRIISQGFMGIYLDKVDEFEYWSDPNNGEGFHISEADAARKMIDFILEIVDYCKEKVDGKFYVIPQNGERILNYDNGKLIDAISGWGVEDLFYWETEPIPSDITDERKKYLDRLLRNGKFILSVDYVDDGSGYLDENKERIDDYIEKARRSYYIPYAALSDRELDELNIIEGVQP